MTRPREDFASRFRYGQTDVREGRLAIGRDMFRGAECITLEVSVPARQLYLDAAQARAIAAALQTEARALDVPLPGQAPG